MTDTPDAPAVAVEHADHAGPHGYASDKEAYLKRMRRIEGQVRGIARMIDEDVYCIDILTQVSAVTKALQAVSIALLLGLAGRVDDAVAQVVLDEADAHGLVEDHLGHCVVDAARQSEEEGAAKVKEAADAIARLVRS